MALKLDILANTRQLVSEMKKGGASVEDITDSLDDMAREGKQSGDKLERSFRDMTREAKKTDAAVEKIGDSGGRGFGKAGDAANEFKSEALSNLSEVTSSFDGSMSSIQDLVQGTLGGLAGSIPGVGLAAAGAAAAVGLIGAAFQQNDEKRLASEEGIAHWAQAYIDAGSTVINAAQVAGEVVAISTDPERYKEAAQAAEDWGVDEGTALRAMAGDTASLEVVRKRLNERQEEATRLLAEQETQVDSNAGKVYDLADAVERGADTFSRLTGEMEGGRERAHLVSDAFKGIINDASSATLEVDEFGNKLYTLPGETQVVVDAETGLASQNVDTFKGDVDGIPETVTTKVKVEVDDGAWRRWQPITKNGKVVAEIMGTGRQVM